MRLAGIEIGFKESRLTVACRDGDVHLFDNALDAIVCACDASKTDCDAPVIVITHPAAKMISKSVDDELPADLVLHDDIQNTLESIPPGRISMNGFGPVLDHVTDLSQQDKLPICSDNPTQEGAMYLCQDLMFGRTETGLALSCRSTDNGGKTNFVPRGLRIARSRTRKRWIEEYRWHQLKDTAMIENVSNAGWKKIYRVNITHLHLPIIENNIRIWWEEGQETKEVIIPISSIPLVTSSMR